VNPDNSTVSLRRILVPLDASAHSRAALEAAIQLAEAIGAEISGLYVEDADLLEVCRYPFAREIGMFPAESRRLESADLERDFRIQAERIRRMMALLTENRAIHWSLTVRRGQVAREILALATSADLVVMGRLGCSMSGGRLGSTVNRLIEAGRGMALLLKEGLRLHAPVITVYTGSALSKRAGEMARRLAQAAGGTMEVLIPASGDAEFEILREEVLSAAAADPDMEGMRIAFRRIRTDVAAALINVLRAEYRQPVVLPVDAIDGDAETVQSLLGRIDNPVLLVQ
jgi:nucleotide-binding universal stress UspA family protein